MKKTLTKRKVISTNQFHFRYPLWQSITLWLLLDRLKAPGYVYGIVGTLMFFWWMLVVADRFLVNPQEAMLVEDAENLLRPVAIEQGQMAVRLHNLEQWRDRFRGIGVAP